jgi:hypothetical protein
MFQNFETMIEGDITHDCQIDGAAFKGKTLYVDARILSPESPGVSPEGRKKIYTFIAKFARQIEYMEEFDRTVVEDLCIEINDSFYNENVKELEETLEQYITNEYRLCAMLKKGYDVKDFEVVVTIQPSELVNVEELLKLKTLTSQL